MVLGSWPLSILSLEKELTPWETSEQAQGDCGHN